MGTDGRVLSHSNLGVKPDQDWTQQHVIFNSLENSEVRQYCGTWGGRAGTLWMGDLKLEESAFVNLLRREGCPLLVTDGAGQTIASSRRAEIAFSANIVSLARRNSGCQLARLVPSGRTYRRRAAGPEC
jgi:hypothetical protein